MGCQFLSVKQVDFKIEPLQSANLETNLRLIIIFTLILITRRNLFIGL